MSGLHRWWHQHQVSLAKAPHVVFRVHCHSDMEDSGRYRGWHLHDLELWGLQTFDWRHCSFHRPFKWVHYANLDIGSWFLVLVSVLCAWMTLAQGAELLAMLCVTHVLCRGCKMQWMFVLTMDCLPSPEKKCCCWIADVTSRPCTQLVLVWCCQLACMHAVQQKLHLP